jgi:hypothetical protein
VACNQAQYIADVTVPDNSYVQPGTAFTKTWRIQNVGTCTWTTSYSLVFVSGSAMTDVITVPLTETVEPGESVDLSARMVAPVSGGIYRGNWMLRSDNGVLFGIGPRADGAFWVLIQTSAPAAQITPNAAFSYDFVAHACEAQWSSGAGALGCPSATSSTSGFIQLLYTPILENKHENEPTLWVQPNHAPDGWVSGIYPGYNVRDGDHFVAWVGCLEDNKGCSVTFRLDYKYNDKVKTLGAWHEEYDGRVTKVDIDLSGLAGKKVQFILYVGIENKQYEKANAFWFVPGVFQVGAAPTQAATATESLPAATPTATEETSSEAAEMEFKLQP